MLSIRRLALVIVVGLILPCIGLAAAESELNGIKVTNSDGRVRLEISTIGEVRFNAFAMREPDRLVIDCLGARYDIKDIGEYPDNAFMRGVRGSQYKREPNMVSRIVVDLKGKVDWKLYEMGDKHIVELYAGTTKQDTPVNNAQAKPKTAPLAVATMGPVLPMTVPEESKPSSQAKPETDDSNSPWITDTVGSNEKGKMNPTNSEQPQEDKGEKKSVPEINSAPVRANADSWAEQYVRGAPASGGGFAMGQRKITLDAQGADIKTVLRTISDFAGVNIVAGKGVEGEIYVHIKDTPWEEALDIMLKAYGFGYREEFGMIRVAEMQQLTKEELDLKTAERRKDELLPLVTRIIFINNSNAEELRMALENIVSQRGMISVDEGSNSLIINDIEKNCEKIATMVKELDKRTYQVDINAKLVEIDVEASQEMGIDWGFLNLHMSGFSGTGSAAVTEALPVSSGTMKFGTVRSWGEFNAVLQMLEKTNKANIISNPRITTMDNREASILVGKEIPLIVADEAGNPITELTKIGIMLKCIPHVNADRTITLDLHPEVSELQSESTAQGGVIIATSEADTRVIVADGETAVIGGLIKSVETDLIRGVPFLKDIPGIGWFFSSKSKTEKKQELVIFVTPTIVE